MLGSRRSANSHGAQALQCRASSRCERDCTHFFERGQGPREVVAGALRFALGAGQHTHFKQRAADLPAGLIRGENLQRLLKAPLSLRILAGQGVRYAPGAVRDCRVKPVAERSIRCFRERCVLSQSVQIALLRGAISKRCQNIVIASELEPHVLLTGCFELLGDEGELALCQERHTQSIMVRPRPVLLRPLDIGHDGSGFLALDDGELELAARGVNGGHQCDSKAGCPDLFGRIAPLHVPQF